MPVREDILQPVGGVKPMPEQRSVGVTTKTITPSVFVTGQYQANPEAKAAELTRLMQNLLAYGIWESAMAAAERGVPAGTYVVVDDPKTPIEEFSVQIVPKIFKRKGNAEEVAVGPRA